MTDATNERQYCLCVLSGLSAGQTIALAPGQSLIIGRSPGCGITLPDRSVSGRHCRLSLPQEGTTLEDLDSTHGTVVNGRKLTVGEERAVNPGDGVEIGGVRLVLERLIPEALDRTLDEDTDREPAAPAAPCGASASPCAVDSGATVPAPPPPRGDETEFYTQPQPGAEEAATEGPAEDSPVERRPDGTDEALTEVDDSGSEGAEATGQPSGGVDPLTAQGPSREPEEGLSSERGQPTDDQQGARDVSVGAHRPAFPVVPAVPEHMERAEPTLVFGDEAPLDTIVHSPVPGSEALTIDPPSDCQPSADGDAEDGGGTDADAVAQARAEDGPTNRHPRTPGARARPGTGALLAAAALLAALLLSQSRDLGTKVVEQEWFRARVPEAWTLDNRDETAYLVYASFGRKGPRNGATPRSGLVLVRSRLTTDCRWWTYEHDVIPFLVLAAEAVPWLRELEWSLQTRRDGSGLAQCVSLLASLPYVTVVGRHPDDALAARARVYLADKQALGAIGWSQGDEPSKEVMTALGSFVLRDVSWTHVNRHHMLSVEDLDEEGIEAGLARAASWYEKREVGRGNAWRAYEELLQIHQWFSNREFRVAGDPDYTGLMEKQWDDLVRASRYLTEQFNELRWGVVRGKREGIPVDDAVAEMEKLIPDPDDVRRRAFKRLLAEGS